MTYKFSVVIKQEGSVYVALCPELDVASQGENLEQALGNLKEAVQLYLESADTSELQLPVHPPLLTTLEVSTA